MDSIKEVLDSMYKDMLSYRGEYESTVSQINSIAKEYTDKINELQKQRLALQEEGNKKLEVLENRRSQLTGMYSSLFEQYKKISGNEPDFNNSGVEIKGSDNRIDTNKDTVVDTPKKSVAKQTDTSKKQDTASKKQVEHSSQLSPAEVAKLSEITGGATGSEKVVDSNGNEVPDYLADSYKK